MGISRADALRRIEGLSISVESHLRKMRSLPHRREYNHWRVEVEAWIVQIEWLLRHIGRRTGAEVSNRVAEWKQALNESPGGDDD